MYIVLQQDTDTHEVYVFIKSFKTIEDAKEAIDEQRFSLLDEFVRAKWYDRAHHVPTEVSGCLLHDPGDERDNQYFSIHEVK